MAPQASPSFSTSPGRSGEQGQGNAQARTPLLESIERVEALLALGQARSLEWQAAAVHVAADEWYRYQRAWLDAVLELDEFAQGMPWLRPQMIDNLIQVFATWCSWTVKTHLATAHGLLSSLTPETLGLPGASGRRAGFDLGRRSGAVVIDFPDRRASARQG